MTTDYANTIKTFIMRATRLPALDNDEDLLETGLVNSLVLAQILAFLEGDLGLDIDDRDVIAGNFRSVNALAELATAKHDAASALTSADGGCA